VFQKRKHQYFVHNFNKSEHIFLILACIVAIIQETKKTAKYFSTTGKSLTKDDVIVTSRKMPFTKDLVEAS